MLKSKAFIKKTRKGAVSKVVREHYLRDDISCGSASCASCAAPEAGAPLSAGPGVTYLVVDTNVVLHQLDLLEHASVANVVLPSVALEEARKRNHAAYTRARAIASTSDRHFYVFANENHRDTFVETLPGESPNDRNDRAIRRAAKWYAEHLAGKGINVVLLSDDADNRAKAEEDGIRALSTSQFAESKASECPDLADRVAMRDAHPLNKEEHRDSRGGKRTRLALYPEHLPEAELLAGVRGGRFHQGPIRMSRYNPFEGFLASESVGRDIIVSGKLELNRAMDGDVAVVELLPQEQWRGEARELPQEGGEAGEPKEQGAAGIADWSLGSNQVDAVGAGARKPCGRVVGILRRAWRSRGYCGSLLAPDRVGGSQSLLFLPVDRRIPKIRIRTRQAEQLLGKRLVVAIDDWPATDSHPQGHYVRTLGEAGTIDTETEVVLHEHDVNSAPFTQAVLNCVPLLPWEVADEHRKQPHREDLRHVCVMSVDPPNCKDIDDALHIRDLGDGTLEAGVHIADVSEFVRPGTAVDKEASLRSTTTYLVQRRIDMLPKALTEEICSLKANVERLTFSVIWRLTPEGDVLESRFTKGLIRSRAALTYAEAQSRIDDPNDKSDIAASLRLMNDLAKNLRRRRFQAGALELASPEVKFRIDPDTLEPKEVSVYETRDTNRMVEELMLLANATVAERILHSFPACSVLRRHPTPTEEMFAPLVGAAASAGFTVDVTTSLALSKSLDKCVREADAFFNKLIRIMATRCMTQAVYFNTAEHSRPEFYHYGLAMPLYTHFTSPIRRYADVFVHRLLAAAIGLEPLPDSSFGDRSRLNAVVDNINTRHRNAQFAGRASSELFMTQYFSGKTQHADGRVVRVRRNAVVVFLPKYGVEGVVYLGEKGSKEWEMNEGESEVRNGKTGQTLRVFDAVGAVITVTDHGHGRRELTIALADRGQVPKEELV